MIILRNGQKILSNQQIAVNFWTGKFCSEHSGVPTLEEIKEFVAQNCGHLHADIRRRVVNQICREKAPVASKT